MSSNGDEEKNEQMMDAIRTRVLDRYNEIQGLENIKENTRANFTIGNYNPSSCTSGIVKCSW